MSAEERQVAEVIARMRHHAELTAMMTVHYSNAPELAVAICEQSPDEAADAETGRWDTRS